MKASWNRLRTKLPWLAVPPVLWWAEPSRLALEVGAALAVLGLLLRAWAAGHIVKDEQLTLTGPYAFTRHPLYLGSFLIGSGLAFATGKALLLVPTLAFFAIVYVRTVRQEERRLEAKHGWRYAEYRRSVPAFVPRPTPYRAAAEERRTFRLGGYLRHREYQAALGVMALMAALLADYFVW